MFEQRFLTVFSCKNLTYFVFCKTNIFFRMSTNPAPPPPLPTPGQGHAGCTLGATLAGITASVGILTTVFSLVESVGIGLLPPAILFAHSTFLCWYAMSSHPDPTCNPWAGDDALSGKGKTVGAAITLALLLSTVAWITWHGEKVPCVCVCVICLVTLCARVVFLGCLASTARARL